MAIAHRMDVPVVHTYHTVYEDYTHYFSPSIRMGRCAVAAFSRWVAAQTDCIDVYKRQVHTHSSSTFPLPRAAMLPRQDAPG